MLTSNSVRDFISIALTFASSSGNFFNESFAGASPGVLGGLGLQRAAYIVDTTASLESIHATLKGVTLPTEEVILETNCQSASRLSGIG